MSYSAMHLAKEKVMVKYGVTEEIIYRRLMADIAMKAPMEELTKFFELSKEPYFDGIAYKVKIQFVFIDK